MKYKDNITTGFMLLSDSVLTFIVLLGVDAV